MDFHEIDTNSDGFDKLGDDVIQCLFRFLDAKALKAATEVCRK